MKEEGVTDDEEITELQIRNSCWRKSIDSTCFSVEAGKKPFSRRAAQQLLTFRPSDVVGSVSGCRKMRWQLVIFLYFLFMQHLSKANHNSRTIALWSTKYFLLFIT